MNLSFSSEILLSALFIFGLRVTDQSLDTLRVLFIMRGRKGVAWVLGFFQALVFVTAISTVLSNIDNPANLIGYAAGFATGGVVGMWIEEKLAVGYSHIRIISSRLGAAITEKLRGEGFAVTEMSARGKDGMVTLINCSVLRKHTHRVEKLVHEVDESAFITTEDVRPLARGFWRA
ncbi:MAG: DUF2179 domain-containing protein [Anaerolineales bacterium]|nr:DUF2179 domain-containing protein [Anaerolineales bacterium]